MLQIAMRAIIRNTAPREWFWLWALGILVLSACAGTAPLRESSSLRLVENVPFYSQKEFQCGPASLAGVLNYRSVRVTPEEIAREIYSPSAKGTLNVDLVLYAQRKGVTTKQYRGSMDNLRMNIDSNNPLLVMVDRGLWIYPVNHFMVVVGYDDEGVIVNSGSDRYKFMALDQFLKSWEKTDFWTLAVKGK